MAVVAVDLVTLAWDQFSQETTAAPYSTLLQKRVGFAVAPRAFIMAYEALKPWATLASTTGLQSLPHPHIPWKFAKAGRP